METSTSQSSSVPKIVGIIVAILVCCSCVVIAAAGVIIFRASEGVPLGLTPFVPSGESTVPPPPTAGVERPPAGDISRQTIETLAQSEVPENDPYELA